ncbi:MAG: peptidylprolyl isomerase [Candidatus Aminicenantales bacterium]
MIRSRLSFLMITLILLSACSGGTPDQGAGAAADKQALRQAVFEAEDSRAPDEASLAVLVKAVKNPDPDIRRRAVRALGRLERPMLGAIIAPLLESAEPRVRSEAANALGQSIHAIRPNRLTEEERPAAAASIAAVADRLSARLGLEKDPAVRGVLAQTVGRLPYPDSSGARKAEETLASAAADGSDRSDPAWLPFLQGLARGYESLLRLNARSFQPGADSISLLKSLAVGIQKGVEDPSIIESSARVRRFALMALAAAKSVDEATLKAASADPDEQVRRLAFAAMESVPRVEAERLARLGLQDRSGLVRFEALRSYGRIMDSADPDPVLAAVDDPSGHVGLLAVDLLGQKSFRSEKGLERLRKLAGSLGQASPAQGAPPVAASWHGPAHALVALAATEPKSARASLPAFLSAEAWPARMYAARAAGLLEDVPALDRLAADAVDNVREAALSELFRLKGHEVDGLLITALERPDYQLIQTAARSLKESPSAAKAVPALFAALTRLTDQKRDTSRDPRLAIIERIAELGSAAEAAALIPYAEDFDVRVAESAATTVERWTGRKPEVRPRPLPIVHARLEEVEKTGAGGIRVTMAGKGAFTLTLLLDEAPATAARFLSLVRAGYYNGLTFHRVVPNYLLQGGSPGANEYMGDGRYLRDELGLESHLRGAVGVSTRGRDTGDAQICPDVCDNIKLDHDYTVFARVTSGMEVVDKVLECDVIEKIEILSVAGRNRP